MNDKLLTATGRIHYGRNWVYLKIDDDIVLYYQWLIKRQFHGGLMLHRPKVGAHISIVRDDKIDPIEKEIKEDMWKQFEGRECEFHYDPTTIVFNGEFFWINTICPTLTEVRVNLGLDPQPIFSYHLTIAKLYPEGKANFSTYQSVKSLFKIAENSFEE